MVRGVKPPYGAAPERLDALYFQIGNDCYPDVPLYQERQFYPPTDWVR